ncbi:MAG: hypothetical protein IJ677_07975 [Alphaproteobacteria bacterium]|nr:hypothetical protein [Alphaproteobacteria bacterium]
MSKLKEKSEYMAMRVSGFLGWVHRVVMLLTFPIRKFWQIVTVCAVVLAILIAIPLCYGIPFRDIWDWYMIKMPNHEFIEAKDKILFNTEEGLNKVKRTIKEIVPNKKSGIEKNKKEEEKDRGPQFISWNVAEFHRARYKPQKSLPVAQKVEVKVAEKQVPIKKEEVVKKAEVAPVENVIIKNDSFAEKKVESLVANDVENYNDVKNNKLAVSLVDEKVPEKAEKINLSDYYVKLRSEDLLYLSKPEAISGDARVVGPNSMYVNGKFVFLYGIYSHPRRHDIEAATQYLKNVTEGRKVNCAVVAYSQKTQSATALCFVNGAFINKLLTEHNLAKNVSLK